MSSVRQLAVLPAGCQPWNGETLATCGHRFAYCSTQAVYVYEVTSQSQFVLSSVMSEHEKSITSLAWHPTRDHIFASSSVDGHIVVWDVVQQRMVAQVTPKELPPNCQPRGLAWCPGDPALLSFLNTRGPLMTWRIGQAATVLKETQGLSSNDVSRYKWHPHKEGRIVFGHGDGSVSLYTSGRKAHRHFPLSVDEELEESDPVLCLEWDSLACGGGDSSCLLASSPSSGVSLLDASTDRLSILMRFHLPNATSNIQCIAWLPSAPGLFVAADSKHGLLRLYNVSQSNALETFRLKKTGFRALQVFVKPLPGPAGEEDTNQSTTLDEQLEDSYGAYSSVAVPPAHVVCAFMDGGVGVYNLQRGRWVHLREMGHVETIFDCQFSPDDYNLLATASFDGSIKVWDVRSFTAVSSSPGNEGIIYSLAWCPHPGDFQHSLAAATSRNGVIVFDTENAAVVKRFTEHKGAVYSVSWSRIGKDLIASGGQDGYCIIRTVKGEYVAALQHPKSVFGVEWSPFHKNMIATGSEDCLIRIFDMTSHTAAPAQILKGHTGKVFHVRFSPMKDDLLCSSSDDKTVRVWDSVSGTCRCVLQGHSGPVRGLVWHWELPYLVVSGSWDASLRLWDIRDGACIESVLDHGADIYGVSWHPRRPFLLATSSRDTTLRLWDVTEMAQAAGVTPLMQDAADELVGCWPVDRGLALGAPPRLCGAASSKIRGKEERSMELLRLLQASPHLENLLDLVRSLQGVAEPFLSLNYNKGIVHRRHMLRHKRATATVAEMSRQTRAVREEHLVATAQRFLFGGNIRRHCELLVRAGRWDRALAMAPAVNLTYWRHLANRYAVLLSRRIPASGAAFSFACGRPERAVCELLRSGQRDEALCAAQALSEGCFAVRDDEDFKDSPANDLSYENDARCTGLGDQLSDQVLASEAEQFLVTGCPVQAACCHLARDDVEGAISKLLRGNELVLAAWVAKTFKKAAMLGCALQYLLRRCDKAVANDIEWDARQFAVTLVQSCKADIRDFALVCFCARQDGGTSEIDALRHTAGLPSLQQSLEKAESLQRQEPGNVEEIVRLFILSTKPEVALQLGIDEIRRRMQRDDWRAADVVRLLWSLANVRPSRLQRKEYRPLVAQLQLISAYVGASLAAVQGYRRVVRPLLQCALTAAQKTTEKRGPLSPENIEQDLNVFVKAILEEKQLSGKEEGRWKQFLLRGQCGGLVFPAALEKGEDFVSGSSLPAHSDINVSIFSSQRVQGPAFFLSDGRTSISLNEALMWAKVNPFSPDGGGTINPF